jgi:putative peptide zinc metalloprotease protein
MMPAADITGPDLANIVPELSGQVTMHEVDSNTYVVHQTEHDLRLKINAFTNRLLSLVDGKKNIHEITRIFNADSTKNIPAQDVYTLLYDGALATNGIIKSTAPIRTENTSSYLKFRIPLIKAKTVYRVSHLLGFLYTPRAFYLSAAILISAMAAVFATQLSLKSLYDVLTGRYILSLAVFSFFTTILHELGHATACRKFGASHGNIGAGFYLFMPVFYADVSDAWKLKPSERVIIDFAGIYMEILVAAILTGLFLIFHNLLFLTTAFFVFIQTYRNLNPFMRFDAYWAVSDYFNIPNLRKDSNLKLKQAFSSVFKRTENPLKSKKDYLLFAYAFLSMALIGAWLFLILVLDMNSVIYLPYNLFLFIKTIFLSSHTISFDWLKMSFLKLLIPASFYFIAGSVLLKQLKTKRDS